MTHEMKKKILSAYAISYFRFSSVVQGKRDSRTRQNASRDRWLEAHPEVPLKREMNDLGLSAFSGKHVAKGDLGDFLTLCESKDFRAETVRRDVYLLVENLDRLSRERIFKALVQLEGILASGVKVVTLCDGKTYDSKSLDSVGEVLMAICTMARAHEESAIKSARIASSWAKKRKEIRDGKKSTSKVLLPTWIRKEGEGFKVNEKAAKVVRRVFELACEGKGVTALRNTMNREGHPSLNHLRRGTGGVWNIVTVNDLLKNRKVIGEIQLRKFLRDENDDYVRDEKGRRQKEDSGDPIKDYYPPIIDPATFAKARKLIFRNFSRRGKRSFHGYNLFSKIAFDKKTGETIQIHTGGKREVKPGQLKYTWNYIPTGIRNGTRKGAKAGWIGWHLEELFFATISQALNVEGSVAVAEADLALAEEQLKDEIHAGARAIRIDPKETDRLKLIEVIGANVQRIDLDCESKEFRCVLMNGIEYDVKKVEGGWSIESDHFDPSGKSSPRSSNFASSRKRPLRSVLGKSERPTPKRQGMRRSKDSIQFK
jgi:DNA invertase Pin-like site-specific DNA recombinase